MVDTNAVEELEADGDRDRSYRPSVDGGISEEYFRRQAEHFRSETRRNFGNCFDKNATM